MLILEDTGGYAVVALRAPPAPAEGNTNMNQQVRFDDSIASGGMRSKEKEQAKVKMTIVTGFAKMSHAEISQTYTI